MLSRLVSLILLTLVLEGAACDTQPAPARPLDASYAVLDANPRARPADTPRPLPAAPEGVRPAQIANRCPGGSERALVVRREGKPERRQPAAEAIAGDGSIVVAEGRHAGQRALPLAAILEEGVETVEIMPCADVPLRLAAKDIAAAPGRYLLVLNAHGEIKVLDTQGPPAPIARNIESIRLLP